MVPRSLDHLPVGRDHAAVGNAEGNAEGTARRIVLGDQRLRTGDQLRLEPDASTRRRGRARREDRAHRVRNRDDRRANGTGDRRLRREGHPRRRWPASTARCRHAAQAQDLASWAKTYGPGGTFWAKPRQRPAGRSRRSSSATRPPTATSTATTPANRPTRARRNLRGAPQGSLPKRSPRRAIKVGLLAQVAEDWTGDWINGMFSAVPNLGSYVAGWTSHPYGTELAEQDRRPHQADRRARCALDASRSTSPSGACAPTTAAA